MIRFATETARLLQKHPRIPLISARVLSALIQRELDAPSPATPIDASLWEAA